MKGRLYGCCWGPRDGAVRHKISRKSGKSQRLKKQPLASPQGFFSLEAVFKKKNLWSSRFWLSQVQCDPSWPRNIPPEAKTVRCLLHCEEGARLAGPPLPRASGKPCPDTRPPVLLPSEHPSRGSSVYVFRVVLLSSLSEQA